MGKLRKGLHRPVRRPLQGIRDHRLVELTVEPEHPGGLLAGQGRIDPGRVIQPTPLQIIAFLFHWRLKTP